MGLWAWRGFRGFVGRPCGSWWHRYGSGGAPMGLRLSLWVWGCLYGSGVVPMGLGCPYGSGVPLWVLGSPL